MVSTSNSFIHEAANGVGSGRGYGFTGGLGSSIHKLTRDTPPPLAQLAMSFTPRQRAELEHQVLLAKYLVANVNIPQELLLPLGIQGALSDRLTSKSMFQGPFSIRDAMAGMGNGSSGTVQQMRCLRTDGKKWQCKKGVVPGQKYCEKHMHRGRHRSLQKKGDNPKDASGDSRSDSPSSQDRSKASDSQPLPGSDEVPAKKAKLEKRDSVNSQANGKPRQDNLAPPRPRSPALPRASVALSARFPSTSSLQSLPPVGHAEFRELYTASFQNMPGRQAPPPAPKFSHLYTRNLSEHDRMQEMIERGLVKPEHDHVGTPPLSSQVFSNGHAAAFASARIGRDGTALPDYSPELTMALLLREERAKADREAIAAGLGYRGGMQPSYMEPPSRDHNLRLQFEDYRSGLPTFPDVRASSALDAYRPSSAHWTQPQVSPSSPSQWQLATSALGQAYGGGFLQRSVSRNVNGGAHSPKTGPLQRQGSESMGRVTSLQRQHSDPLTLAGNGVMHVGDASQDGLPPHLAFLAKNNNAGGGNMQPFDEERGLVRTHSLVKGGSLANRHSHRSILSRQPSLHSDDPEKPWLAVSMGRGWDDGVGGPLGEALLRTASGSPVPPEDKPGKGLSAEDAAHDDFEQFVSEPLDSELVPQSDLSGATTANEQPVRSSDKTTEFESFSLDGKPEGFRVAGKGFEGADLNELGEGPQLIAGT